MASNPSSSTPTGTVPASLASLPLISSGSPTLPGSLAVGLASGSGAADTRVTPSLNALPTKEKPPAFSLASSFPPIPGKWVKKIQCLEFVEMRDLLPDNVALPERLEALPALARSTDNIPQREIASVNTWTCAFATYVAVVARAHPERVCDMLAYMRLIVREAQKHEGSLGWLTYDSVFRQNNQGAEARWDKLDPSLYTWHTL